MSDSDCCTTLEKIKELLGKHENGEHEKNENKEKPNITYEPYKDKYTSELMRIPDRSSSTYHQDRLFSGGNRKSKKSKKSKKGKRSRKARKSRRKSNRRRGRR